MPHTLGSHAVHTPLLHCWLAFSVPLVATLLWKVLMVWTGIWRSVNKDDDWKANAQLGACPGNHTTATLMIWLFLLSILLCQWGLHVIGTIYTLYHVTGDSVGGGFLPHKHIFTGIARAWGSWLYLCWECEGESFIIYTGNVAKETSLQHLPHVGVATWVRCQNYNPEARKIEDLFTAVWALVTMINYFLFQLLALALSSLASVFCAHQRCVCVKPSLKVYLFCHFIAPRLSSICVTRNQALTKSSPTSAVPCRWARSSYYAGY